MSRYIDLDKLNISIPENADDEFKKGVEYVMDQINSISGDEDIFSLRQIDDLQSMLYAKLANINPESASYNCYDDVLHGISYVKDRLKAGLVNHK